MSHFRCARLEARLTVADCANRYTRAHKNTKDISGMQQHFRGCGDCDVGRGHAQGYIMPVPLVELIPVKATKPITPDVCQGCGGPLPPPGDGAAGRLRRRACSTYCREILTRGGAATFYAHRGMRALRRSR